MNSVEDFPPEVGQKESLFGRFYVIYEYCKIVPLVNASPKDKTLEWAIIFIAQREIVLLQTRVGSFLTNYQKGEPFRKPPDGV